MRDVYLLDQLKLVLCYHCGGAIAFFRALFGFLVLNFSSHFLLLTPPGKKSTTGDTTSSSKPRSKQKLLQTESSDFKLVFISSDSSKDSDQLNSSLENAATEDCSSRLQRPESNNNNEFIHNADMEYEDDVLGLQTPPELPPKTR